MGCDLVDRTSRRAQYLARNWFDVQRRLGQHGAIVDLSTTTPAIPQSIPPAMKSRRHARLGLKSEVVGRRAALFGQTSPASQPTSHLNFDGAGQLNDEAAPRSALQASPWLEHCHSLADVRNVAGIELACLSNRVPKNRLGCTTSNRIGACPSLDPSILPPVFSYEV